MATPIENLKAGDWIAITGQRSQDSIGTLWTGEPVQVKNISLPFIAAKKFLGDVFAIDVRVFDVQKMSRGYVNAMLKDRLTELNQLRMSEPNAVNAIMRPSQR